MQKEYLAEMKDNGHPKTPHCDEILALAQILVLNKIGERWVAAKQENTGPLPTKPSFSSNFFSSSDQTSVCKYQVATILIAKICITWGEKTPIIKYQIPKNHPEERPYFQFPRGLLLLFISLQISPIPVPGNNCATKSHGADSYSVPSSQSCISRMQAPARCHQLTHQLACHPTQESHPLKHRDGNKKAADFQETISNCLILAYVLTLLYAGS